MASRDKRFLGRPQGDGSSGTWVRSQNTASSISDLQGLASADAVEGEEWYVQTTSPVTAGRYMWVGASVLAADAVANLIVVPTDGGVSGAGRWVKQPGTFIDVALAVTYATADAAVLFTVPTGCKLRLVSSYWTCTVTFAGGSSSKIGLKGGAATGLNTAGDILGGSSGDGTIASTTAYPQGTVGTKMHLPQALLQAADTVIFNQMTSTFTSGVGIAHLLCHVLVNAGA